MAARHAGSRSASSRHGTTMSRDGVVAIGPRTQAPVGGSPGGSRRRWPGTSRPRPPMTTRAVVHASHGTRPQCQASRGRARPRRARRSPTRSPHASRAAASRSAARPGRATTIAGRSRYVATPRAASQPGPADEGRGQRSPRPRSTTASHAGQARPDRPDRPAAAPGRSLRRPVSDAPERRQADRPGREGHAPRATASRRVRRRPRPARSGPAAGTPARRPRGRRRAARGRRPAAGRRRGPARSAPPGRGRRAGLATTAMSRSSGTVTMAMANQVVAGASPDRLEARSDAPWRASQNGRSRYSRARTRPGVGPRATSQAPTRKGTAVHAQSRGRPSAMSVRHDPAASVAAERMVRPRSFPVTGVASPMRSGRGPVSSMLRRAGRG